MGKKSKTKGASYEEEAKKWLSNGAQPTAVVGKLFKIAGIVK